jgi:hypothetical protein
MATKAKGIQDLRAAYDSRFIIPDRVGKGLESLLKCGPESWEYEQEFCKRANISTVLIGRFRDKFKDFVVETGGHKSKYIWCCSKKLAKRAKELIDNG